MSPKELSRFLPSHFDKSQTVAIMAGKGIYPKLLKDSAASLGVKIKLIAFEGETSSELKSEFEDFAEINAGELGKLLKALKKFDAKYAIMAGQITPKKLFKGLKLDLKAMTILARLKRRNAETIFGAIAEELGKIGVEMLDARSFMDSSIAPSGFFCGSKWSVEEHHLEHGIQIAKECAKLDIGQGCVVARGTVLAVEAFEGTDKMLERAGSFEAVESLFVKTVKPNQDYRFDVPVIGERTLKKLAESKIKNVAIESGKLIILDMEKVKSLAQENGIKIFGYQ